MSDISFILQFDLQVLLCTALKSSIEHLNKTPSYIFSWAYLFISLPWHFTCKLKALAICQDTSSTPHWATTHAHMSSSCSFMSLEQAKLGKSEEPCSAARCMQNQGICRTASQLCTCWPRKVAETLRASYVCPFYSAFQLGQGSPACIKSPLCPPSVLTEEWRQGTNPLLWLRFLKQRNHQLRAQVKQLK